LENGRAYLGHYGNEFLCVDLKRKAAAWTYRDREFPFFSCPALGAELAVIGGRDKRVHAVRKQTGEPVWRARTRGRVDSSPVIARGRVVAGSEDGLLYMWDLATGEEVWSYEIGDSVVAAPAVAQGKIFIGAEDGLLYAFGEEGAGQRSQAPRPVGHAGLTTDAPR
jgi:outer membrane protein assembly factor BamB